MKSGVGLGVMVFSSSTEDGSLVFRSVGNTVGDATLATSRLMAIVDDLHVLARLGQEGMVLGDPRASGERARRGREFVLEHYTWHKLAGRLLTAWEQAVAGGGQARPR